MLAGFWSTRAKEEASLGCCEGNEIRLPDYGDIKITELVSLGWRPQL